MHGHRKHALLSPSGASRWINCTPSARLEERFIEDESSFAKEGTLAHEFAELFLRTEIEHDGDGSEAIEQEEALKASPHYYDGMIEDVAPYVEHCLEAYKAAQKRGHCIAMIEDRIDLTDYIEEGFGSNDFVIAGDGILEVWDLKFGKGVRVDAEENPQLMLYGLGALDRVDLMYSIHTVRLVVDQPRLGHLSKWEISADDLRKWAEKTVKPAAKKAYAGEGLQQAGAWCRWCKAGAKCATLASQSMKAAKSEFAEECNPRLLKDSQLIDIYAKLGMIKDWVEAVSKHMLTEAIGGKTWPGLKIVEGRSIRKWKDENEAIAKLQELGHDKEKITNTKIKGIGDIEKLIGKKIFPDIMEGFFEKPQGKPALVPESDKRPPMKLASAEDDFENDLK